MMAACVRTWILKLCVFTKIFLLISAQTEHMTNVAINKPCNISSQYEEGHSSNNCSAAINGNTGTTFMTGITSQNCIHTDLPDFHPVWSVDLGQNFPVHRITIYGRNQYERRMNCVQVWLDGRELYKFPCPGTTTVITDIPVNPPQRGRVVNITKDPYRYPEPYLNICEVQIWVCSIGWWGSDCQNQCSCQDKDNYCDPQSGTCLKTNVAIHKPCNISSRYVENGLSNNCSAAINGNTSTAFVIKQTSQNCIHTSLSDSHPTWSVDLGQNFSVHSITIYGRDNLERRMGCVEVFLDGRELYKFPCPGTTTVRTDIYVNPPQRGRVVSITRDQRLDYDPVPLLNICEVQIWVCSIGWWGSDCQHQCSCQDQNYYCDPDNGMCSKVCSSGYWGENCLECGAGCSNVCDAKNGSCRCTNGWTGPQCTECSTGHWGDDCSYVCGRGCKNGACNVYNGTCECKSGWATPRCDVCSDSHYNMSNDCHNTCGKGCHDTCSKTDGTCQCRTGWQPPLCQVCSSGYWGENCTACGAGCSNACDAKTGSCSCTNGWTGPQCTDCSDGHYNMSNDCQNTCGEGCNNICNRTDGTCQCRTRWHPPLCQEHVTTVCSSGYWGENCTVCGAGCSNTCDFKSGACRCTNGWTGPQCTDCSHGHYNMSNDCQNTCGRGCHDTCSRTDGTCQCRTGWQPPLCQHCSDGHYNESNDCQNTCGEGCNNTCSRTDGTCQCQTGWQPPLCQRKNTSAMMSSCDDKEALIGAGPVAGIAVGCAIVFFILGFLSGLRLRLSRSHQPSATHGSPVKTSVTSDLGASSTTTHPAEPLGSTSSEDTSDHSNNVYDELKARNDDSKSAYTSLRFQNKGKESAAPSDYINTRKILMNE